jgi:DNA-binding NtrC family response regulator
MRPLHLSLTAASAELRASTERTWIEEAIARTATLTAAAVILGINVRTLYKKMVEYSISPSRFQGADRVDRPGDRAG